MRAEDIIEAYGLTPHPEGGWYRQTWIADAPPGTRPAGTAIYFLLEAGQRSHWHRVDAAEIWHWYAGAPMELTLWQDGAQLRHVLSGLSPLKTPPQAIVAPHQWQAARPLCTEETPDFSLVGCTVSPAFRFEGFELAPEGWTPEDGQI